MARPGPLVAGQRFPITRRAPRYPVSASAEAIDPVSNMRVSGRVTVLSLTGCYVLVGNMFDVGTMLRLRIEHDSLTLETWARVANATLKGMGVAFLDMTQPQLAMLNGWLEVLKRKRLRALENVASEEIEKAATLAGFEPNDIDDPARLVFVRGPYALVVNADATWICYAELGGGRRTNGSGYTFHSLLNFLDDEFSVTR